MQAVQKWLHFCTMPNPSLLLFQPKNEKLEHEHQLNEKTFCIYFRLIICTLSWTVMAAQQFESYLHSMLIYQDKAQTQQMQGSRVLT